MAWEWVAAFMIAVILAGVFIVLPILLVVKVSLLFLIPTLVGWGVITLVIYLLVTASSRKEKKRREAQAEVVLGPNFKEFERR